MFLHLHFPVVILYSFRCWLKSAPCNSRAPGSALNEPGALLRDVWKVVLVSSSSAQVTMRGISSRNLPRPPSSLVPPEVVNQTVSLRPRFVLRFSADAQVNITFLSLHDRRIRFWNSQPRTSSPFVYFSYSLKWVKKRAKEEKEKKRKKMSDWWHRSSRIIKIPVCDGFLFCVLADWEYVALCWWRIVTLCEILSEVVKMK